MGKMQLIRHCFEPQKADKNTMIAFFYFLLDFGDLLFMRRWYSSCAWLDKLGCASANRTSSFAFGIAQVFRLSSVL